MTFTWKRSGDDGKNLLELEAFEGFRRAVPVCKGPVLTEPSEAELGHLGGFQDNHEQAKGNTEHNPGESGNQQVHS